MTRIGSCCSGYCGLDLGLMEVVGGSVAWHVEYDKHPAAVLDARFPGVPNHGDVTTTDWSSVEPVDWLTAGYPCQPFSHAGKRKGKDDERHLWPFVADAIGVLRPRNVLLENVRGHVSLGLADVLADLSGLGYDARWGVVRAADAGAPHGRARIFIVACAADADGGNGRGWAALGRVQEAARAGDQAAPADASGQRHGGGLHPGRVGRLDREDAGEARQRERARPVAGDRGGAAAADADLRGLTSEWQSQSAGIKGPRWDDVRDRLRQLDNSPAWASYAPAIHRWEAITGRPAPRPTEPGRRGERLSPRFVEWMMGLPDGWVTDILPRNPALKALGNGVVPQQAALALRLLGVTAEAVAA